MQNKRFLILFIMFLYAGISQSESINSVNQNLGALVQQINIVNKDLVNKQKQQKDLNKAITDSNNAIHNANKLLRQLQATRDINLQQLERLSVQLPQLTNYTNNSKQQVQLAINKIYRQLIMLQQNESSSIFGSNLNLDAQRKKIYLIQLLKFEQHKYQNLKTKLDSLTDLNIKLQAEVDRLNQELANATKKESELQVSKQAKLATHDDLDKQIANSKSKLFELKQQQAKLNDLVVKLRQAQANLENNAKLAKVNKSNIQKSVKNPIDNIGDGTISDNSPLLLRKLTKPVNADISVGFGDMRDGITNSGVVFNVHTNIPVYAISSGKVLYSGVLPGFGQLVVVDNGNDYNSIYSGILSSVKKGNIVKGGQLIGYSGDKTNQPMGGVYFELRHLGKPINPNNVFH